MSLNSVITNVNAQVALQSLNITGSQLAATQKEISTGYRVADATDDGAAYAIAQRVRSDVAGLTSANQQLGNAQGLLDTTLSSLNDVSNTLISINQTLVKLADSNVSGAQRTEYGSTLASEVTEVRNYFSDATYNGKSLVGDLTNAAGVAGTASGFTTIRNETGGTFGVTSFSASAFATSLTSLNVSTQTVAQAAITATGVFQSLTSKLGQVLNRYGAANNYISSQISYNSNKIDALNSGLGSLIDANLAQESAQLTALQIRQQLGTQALSIANQSPQSLLSLFK
jgi:flagellin